MSRPEFLGGLAVELAGHGGRELQNQRRANYFVTFL